MHGEQILGAHRASVGFAGTEAGRPLFCFSVSPYSLVSLCGALPRGHMSGLNLSNGFGPMAITSSHTLSTANRWSLSVAPVIDLYRRIASARDLHSVTNFGDTPGSDTL